jgi:Protein of unknown function (DUF3606)
MPVCSLPRRSRSGLLTSDGRVGHIECQIVGVSSHRFNMSDDKAKTGLDRRLIAMNQPYEVRDWCKALSCSKEELQRAVVAVGPSVEKVREYLNEQS